LYTFSILRRGSEVFSGKDPTENVVVMLDIEVGALFGLKGEFLMYSVTRLYEGVTDAKEVANRVKTGYVPLCSQLPGFISYSLVDAGGGVFVATNVFLTQADAEEANRRTADWVRENLASFVSKPPKITGGEVVAYK
jgi:hypothetical protein